MSRGDPSNKYCPSKTQPDRDIMITDVTHVVTIPSPPEPMPVILCNVDQTFFIIYGYETSNRRGGLISHQLAMIYLISKVLHCSYIFEFNF